MLDPESEADVCLSSRDAVHAEAGDLDGITIMRYAHISRNRISGGVEQYLHHLDRKLLQRHRLTIVQTYLVEGQASNEVEAERVGIGRILWVPVVYRRGCFRLSLIRSWIRGTHSVSLQNVGISDRERGSAFRSSMQRSFSDRLAQLRHRNVVSSGHLSEMLRLYPVDLLALHWLSYDTEALMHTASRSGIPFVFVNHHENVRLALPIVRKWMSRAAAIGTVSDCGIPDEIQAKYAYLSDAVDTDYFDPEKAKGNHSYQNRIILLAARIDNGKGHGDLIQVAGILKKRGVDCVLYFAGAVESKALECELRDRAAAAGLTDKVLFLGEQNREEIRDLYSSSSIVVLPSYSEGLPRVLLEAQSMKKPVIAYNSGGVMNAMVPDESGFILDKGDLAGMAAKTELLLQNGDDNSRMGERGRDFVRRSFNLNDLVHRHEKFYIRALARCGKSNAMSLSPEVT
jgi:glycosyltransferase involved in cell wall biosynthesis